MEGALELPDSVRRETLEIIVNISSARVTPWSTDLVFILAHLMAVMMLRVCSFLQRFYLQFPSSDYAYLGFSIKIYFSLV